MGIVTIASILFGAMAGVSPGETDLWLTVLVFATAFAVSASRAQYNMGAAVPLLHGVSPVGVVLSAPVPIVYEPPDAVV